MELTIEQTLHNAVAAHNAGKLEEAERLYRAILQSQPAHPDANHNLGLIAVSVNQAEAALPLFKTALEINPKIEQFWLSYIDALIKGKQFDDARQILEQAKKQGVAGDKVDAIEAQITTTTQVNEPKLVVQKKSLTLSEKRKKLAEQKKQKKAKKQNLKAISPSDTEIKSLLEHYQNGRYDDAEKLAKSITQQFPAHPFAWTVLGAVLKQTGRVSESLFAKHKAVELEPLDAQAHYNLGTTLQELGRLDEAESSYMQAIALKPDFANAHYNLGITLNELGRLKEAEASYTQAIALKPDFAEAYSNLGNSLQELGRLEEAEASYTQAIALKPDYAEAHNNLGITLKELGRLDEAEASYTQAIALKPDYAEAYSNLGNTLQELGRLAEAEASYIQAIALKPDYAEAHSNLGATLKELGRLDEAETSYTQAISLKPDYAEAHNNLGATLQELGREAAIDSYKNAIKIKPDYAEAYNNMAIVLDNKGDLEEAINTYEKALKIKPDYAEAYNNMGTALKKKGDLEAAIDSYKQALKIKPDYAEAYYNVGVVLQDKGNLKAAIDSYKQAIKIEPDYAEAFYNTSLVNLSLQDFEAGWSLHEWRWKIKKVFSNPLKSTKPLWSPSKKQRVLLWCEQGVGDEIMFASLIPDLYSASTKLIVLIDERLIPLFRRSFPDDIDFRPSNEVVSETEYDSQIPMGSVPLYFRQTIDRFKNSAQGWLSASSVKAKNLRSQLLSDDSETLIGISWHSTASMKSRAENKAIPLNKIAPFLHSSKVKLVSLQYGDVDHEIKKLLIDFGIKVIQVPEIDNMNDIDGLAALISACDEVVSIDNVTAHLAGSLGKQSKILLTYSCNWNWGQGQQNSYWYNSIQLYRQTKIGDWEHVIKQL